MSYVQKTLQPGETLIYRTSLHWIVFLPSIAAIAVGFGLHFYSQQLGTMAGVVSNAGWVLVILGVVMGISVWIQYISTEMAITNRRVIAKVGFIWRHTIEMERQKVESVSVNQSILGRILDYGTIVVRGTGSTLEPMSNIDSPMEFRSRLLAG